VCREREGERDVGSKLRGEGGSWWRGRVLPIGSLAALSHFGAQPWILGGSQKDALCELFFSGEPGRKIQEKGRKEDLASWNDPSFSFVEERAKLQEL